MSVPSVTFTITENDIAATASQIAKYNPTLRAYFRNVQLLIACFPTGMIALAMLIMMGGVTQATLIMIVFGAIALYMLARIILQSYYARQIVKATLAKNPNALSEMTCAVQPDGFLCKSPGVSSLIPWSKFERFYQDPAYLFLWLGGDNYITIPRKAFKSLTAQQDFLDELLKRLPYFE